MQLSDLVQSNIWRVNFVRWITSQASIIGSCIGLSRAADSIYVSLQCASAYSVPGLPMSKAEVVQITYDPRSYTVTVTHTL
jgi:hypothetical protein